MKPRLRRRNIALRRRIREAPKPRNDNGLQSARRLSAAVPTLPDPEPGPVTRYVLGVPQRGRPRRADRIETNGRDRTMANKTKITEARALLGDAAAVGAAAMAPTVRAFASAFLADCAERWKPATRETYARTVRRWILPAFGNRPVDAIGAKDVRNWRDDIAATRPGSAHWALAAMSSMMKHAEALGLRREDSNPCKGLRRRKSGFEAHYLSDDGFAALGRALDDAEADHPDAVAALRFLLYTGARKSEALRLKWEHVHGDRAVLPDSKTGPRTIWLASPARAVLAAQPRRADCPWVFASPCGGPVPMGNACNAIRGGGLGDAAHPRSASQPRGGRGQRGARACAPSPGCSVTRISRPPSAMRTWPSVPCSTRPTGSRTASPPCSTAGRRADDRARPPDRCAGARGPAAREGIRRPRYRPAGLHAARSVERRAVLSVPLPARRQGATGHARQARRGAGRRRARRRARLPRRETGGGSPSPLPPSGPTLAKFAAEYVERRAPAWKPSTVKATMSYLNSAILPARTKLDKLGRLTEVYWPQLRILHPWPNKRFAVNHPR